MTPPSLPPCEILPNGERHRCAAAYSSPDTDRYHVHLAINKVSLDGRVLDRWQDYAKLGRAAEWCEREMGLLVDRHVAWREKLGERELGLMPEFEPELVVGVAQGLDRQEGATIDRRDAVRRTHYSWVDVLKREALARAAHAAPSQRRAPGHHAPSSQRRTRSPQARGAAPPTTSPAAAMPAPTQCAAPTKLGFWRHRKRTQPWLQPAQVQTQVRGFHPLTMLRTDHSRTTPGRF
jgi:hypothetical protein